MSTAIAEENAMIEPKITTLDGTHELYGGEARRVRIMPLSASLHAVAALAFVLLPILRADALPEVSQEGVRAFFVEPTSVQPPPPPPPPPASASLARRAEAPLPRAASFSAPLEAPLEIEAEDSLSFGIEGGVPGGVEGGVPGGVIGGVVGGLADTTPPPDRPRAVRVGGSVLEPKKVKNVSPTYPELALRARIEGMVVLEAEIAPNGSVAGVKVLSGIPMLDDAAMEAVRRWRYTPTLVDGVPTTAIMTVTVHFRITDSSLASMQR